MKDLLNPGDIALKDQPDFIRRVLLKFCAKQIIVAIFQGLY
jgi:hypothetical protein